jgi:HSP20 family protein
MFRRALAPLRCEKDLGALDIKIDVVEKDGHFKVRADFPGIKKENINVRIDGNRLKINAESKGEKEFNENDGKVLSNERYYGTASRA